VTRSKRGATSTGRHSHAAALNHALGARNGIALAAAAEPDAEGQTTAELWLYGVVGGYWWGFNDKTVADQLRGLNVDHITVRLNSPGGDAIQGIAIGNLFRNHKANVTVVVDGLAASAASIIAIAADEVVMSPGSQMMIHDPWFFTMGNAKELRQDADFLDKQGANMASVYALRAGGTAEEWRTAMTAEPDGTWYTADEAVTAKLADRVGTVVAVGAAPEPPALVDGEDDETLARAAWDLEFLISPAARAAWSSGSPQTPDRKSADGSTETEGGSAVAFSDEQITTMRDTLGLPESADETAILAALEGVVDAATAPPAPTPPQIPEGTTLVDSNVLADLQAGATAGRAAQQTLAAQDRDTAITAALAAGKLAATSRDSFVAAWDKDPEGTRAILDALTPGLVPTIEAGHADDSEDADAPFEAAHAALLAKHGIPTSKEA
jgi:ATP-dependent protease ClpP protease subunit